MSRPFRSIYTLSFAHLVTDIYMPVITAVLPLLIADRGLTFFSAGLLVTAYNLTSSATQPLFGWLSDNQGRQVHVSTSLLISAAFMALIGVVTSYPLLLLCASLAAIGHACFHPNALSIVSRSADNLNRARITALFVVGGNIGYALGPILAGAVVFAFGLPGLLLLLPPALILAVILRYLLPPVSRSASPPSSSTPSLSLHALPPIRSLFAASTLRAWAVFSAIAFFPPLLITRGYDLFTADLLITVMLFAGVGGQLTGGVPCRPVWEEGVYHCRTPVFSSFCHSFPFYGGGTLYRKPDCLWFLPLVKLCGNRRHVPRAHARERRGGFRPDARAGHRGRGHRCGGQRDTCRPLFPDCSPGHNPVSSLCRGRPHA